MNKIKTVFVDSDAFIALAKENDNNHKRAKQIINQLSKKSILYSTSNYVFSETVTVISQRVGHKQAIAFIQELKSPKSLFSMHWINEKLERLSIQIFKKQTSKNTSFVDCTNMAIMQHHRFDAIFSFDTIYKRNGFALAEEVVKYAQH